MTPAIVAEYTAILKLIIASIRDPAALPLAVAIATILTMAILNLPTTMPKAYADRKHPCINNGNPSCQHFNNGNDAFVGSPHYPNNGGEKTGNPHGQSVFNPETGNPHCGAAEGCVKP